MSIDNIMKRLTEILGITRDVLEKKVGRTIRIMSYRGIDYVVLREDVGGYCEGTIVLLNDEKIIHGYPGIRRLALLEGVPLHMVDEIIVEEKMNGYNVRVVLAGNKVLAITRGGYICPYTTARIEKMYGDRLREALSEYEDVVLAGEVIGTENPYVVYEYPEARGFDYFVFDVMKNGALAPLSLRDEIVDKYGLKRVPVLARLNKNELEKLREIVDDLDRRGREGIVIKDPMHRVPPLKYTTIYINIKDIEEGMKYPFDEGRSYLFSRIIRLVCQAYEYGLSDEELDHIALRLGRAVLRPAVESLKKRSMGRLIAATYKLVFPSEEDLRDYLEFLEELGVDVVVKIIGTSREGVKAELMKLKDTHGYYSKILETGYSPLD